jgi:hypothetical protein
VIFFLQSRGRTKAHGFFICIRSPVYKVFDRIIPQQHAGLSCQRVTLGNTMNIVLIGYRCSGKTEVGKLLARELGMEFVDTDLLIEEDTGCSIESIISEKGWDHFRKIERRMIEAGETIWPLPLEVGL